MKINWIKLLALSPLAFFLFSNITLAAKECNVATFISIPTPNGSLSF